MALPNTYFSGNLTRDPELRYTSDGTPVVNFTVACGSRRFNKQSNQWEDADTTFLDCSMFDKSAEMVAQLAKGTAVTGSGVLKQESWEKDGQKRSKIAVRVNELATKVKPQKSDAGFAPAGQGFGQNQSDDVPF